MTGHEWSAVDDVAKALGFVDSEALGVGYCSSLVGAGCDTLHTLARLIREVRSEPECHQTVIHLHDPQGPRSPGGFLCRGLCGKNESRLNFVGPHRKQVTCKTCMEMMKSRPEIGSNW